MPSPASSKRQPVNARRPTIDGSGQTTGDRIVSFLSGPLMRGWAEYAARQRVLVERPMERRFLADFGGNVFSRIVLGSSLSPKLFV